MMQLIRGIIVHPNGLMGGVGGGYVSSTLYCQEVLATVQIYSAEQKTCILMV